MIKKILMLLACFSVLSVLHVNATSITFNDPVGDDYGPGNYIYPTNPVYTPGSFDMTQLRISDMGDQYLFEVDVNAPLKDAWNTGVGFDIQMFFVFIDQGKGVHTKGITGLNIEFDEDSKWQNVVIISPQSSRRISAETRKAGTLKSSIIIPQSTQGSGKTISSLVSKESLNSNPKNWRIQVVGQSNEGFPEGSDLLTRRVNSNVSDHRFGGGHDGRCDPHVIDILGSHEQLNYECDDSGKSISLARLKLMSQ